MAVDIQEVLGDLLLTAPVNRDEWELPSPAALHHKIILKHKKLQMEEQQQQSADSATLLGINFMEDDSEQDILSRNCIKKGVLWLRNAGGGGGNAAGAVNGSFAPTGLFERIHFINSWTRRRVMHKKSRPEKVFQHKMN